MQLLLLQIREPVFTNEGNPYYYKSGQLLQIMTDLLQIRATFTNRYAAEVRESRMTQKTMLNLWNFKYLL